MKFVVIFLVMFQTLFGYSLKERFQQGDKGTYIVTEQNKILSLLHLHSIEENRLLFEEVSIPSHQLQHNNWKEWVKNGALGHTSWILYEVDLKQNKITECYSLSRKTWMSLEEINTFFLSLLNLKLQFLSEQDRIQKGPTPAPGNIGRGPWCPPQFIEGKKVKHPKFDVFTAIWPSDNTELSQKHIVLYFDKTKENFPFPYWIQAREGGIKFKIRAIDSGTGMSSPIKNIPKRSPIFHSGIQQKENKISLFLNVPSYYSNLKLYAIDLTENSQLTHTIPFDQSRFNENVTVTIKTEELKEFFINNHEYLWIVGSEDSEMIVKFPYPFKWTLEN